MLIQFCVLLLGFVILMKGADVFVEGASSVAKHLHVPDILIGLTIVAFGTSAPEASVSIRAVLAHSSDMVLGNIVGSNILNILLILGITAVISPMAVKENTVKKEIPFCLLISVLTVVLLMDHIWNEEAKDMISRQDGLVILIFFTIFIYYLVSVARHEKTEAVEAKYPLGKAVCFSLISLVAVITGGNWVVSSASFIAEGLGVSQRFIALTIVALGTSLPELMTSIMAARKGKPDLALGNIIGSNIFNLCFVIGGASAFIGDIIPSTSLTVDLMVMLLATCLLFLFACTGRRISRKEGTGFLILFVIYYGYLIITQLNI